MLLWVSYEAIDSSANKRKTAELHPGGTLKHGIKGPKKDALKMTKRSSPLIQDDPLSCEAALIPLYTFRPCMEVHHYR